MTKWQRIKYHPNLPLGENGQRVTACAEHIELSKNAAKEGISPYTKEEYMIIGKLVAAKSRYRQSAESSSQRRCTLLYWNSTARHNNST